MADGGAERRASSATSPWLLGAITGAAAAVAVGCIALGWSLSKSKWSPDIATSSAPATAEARDLLERVARGWPKLIGRTPLVRIRSLSEATGCNVLVRFELARIRMLPKPHDARHRQAKCEHLNPCGSPKDRVALRILCDAIARGDLKAGDGVVEGTSGSTGISLAALCRFLGMPCRLFLPDDTGADKIRLLETLGAVITRVPPVSIVNKGHYVNRARAFAASHPVDDHDEDDDEDDDESRSTLPSATTTTAGAAASRAAAPVHESRPTRWLFADQFEAESNFRAHLEGTGVEIWEQTAGGQLDAFVMGAGTGGTIAGVSQCLRQRAIAAGRPPPRIVLADPPGSSLANRVRFGTLFAPQQAERAVRRARYDTVIEGVGLDRLTSNFARAAIDEAESVSDAEAVSMARRMVREEGLFLGSSSAMNLVAAERVAKRLGSGHTVVTVLCDSGHRHMARFWNDAYLVERGLSANL